MATWTEHIDGVITVVCEGAPVGDGEGFGEAGDTREEVILPRKNGSFGGVGAMDIRWCVLESDALGMDEVFHVLRRFVVHLVQSRFEATSFERIVGRLVGAKKLFLGAILDGHGCNEVGIINVKL